LEVYSEQDKIRLQDAVVDDWEVLHINDPTKIDKEEHKRGDDINWQTEKEAEKEKLLEQIKADTCAKISLAPTNGTTENEPFDLQVYIDEI
jgi:hypothetical protein